MDHFQKLQIGLKVKNENENVQKLSYSMKGSTPSSADQLIREGDHVVDTHVNVVVHAKRDHFLK